MSNFGWMLELISHIKVVMYIKTYYNNLFYLETIGDLFKGFEKRIRRWRRGVKEKINKPSLDIYLILFIKNFIISNSNFVL